MTVADFSDAAKLRLIKAEMKSIKQIVFRNLTPTESRRVDHHMTEINRMVDGVLDKQTK